MKNVSYHLDQDCYVISDVHLRHPWDKETQHFLDVLKGLTRPCTMVFLGDIFDFIFAGHKLSLGDWFPFFSCLKNLVESNCTLYFLEGNHDFGFAFFQRSYLSQFFKYHGDSELTLKHPVLGGLFLSHGDHVLSDARYQIFRRFIKNRLTQSVFLYPFPQRLLGRLGLWFSNHSRGYEHRESKRLSHLIRTHIPVLPHGTVIMGHIHVHCDHVFQGTHGSVRFLTGPSWSQAPSYLRIGLKGDVERVFINSAVPLFQLV